MIIIMQKLRDTKKGYYHHEIIKNTEKLHYSGKKRFIEIEMLYGRKVFEKNVT